MKKTIAIAALIAASLSVPALPVQAATLGEWAAENSHCLWFGAFKRECWEAADEVHDDVVAEVKAEAEEDGWNVGLWRDCDLAEPGASTLLVCE